MPHARPCPHDTCRLVAPGHVTEGEFWSSKKGIVRAVRAQTDKQKVGLPSRLLGVLDSPVDARTGKVNVNITPALERQIFAEYPSVSAMFSDAVPDVRTRKQFFEEFIKALKNRITRRRKKAAGPLQLPPPHATEPMHLALLETPEGRTHCIPRWRLPLCTHCVLVRHCDRAACSRGQGVGALPTSVCRHVVGERRAADGL